MTPSDQQSPRKGRHTEIVGKGGRGYGRTTLPNGTSVLSTPINVLSVPTFNVNVTSPDPTIEPQYIECGSRRTQYGSLYLAYPGPLRAFAPYIIVTVIC